MAVNQAEKLKHIHPIKAITDFEAYYLDWYKDKVNEDRGPEHTEIGKCIYQLKYVYTPQMHKPYNDLPNWLKDAYMNELFKLAGFVGQGLREIGLLFDFLIPAPSFNPRTRWNPNGQVKFIYDLVNVLSDQLGVPYHKRCLFKKDNVTAKDTMVSSENFEASCIRLPEDFPSYSRTGSAQPIGLVIDDLFERGDTAKISLSLLKTQNPGMQFKFLSCTKNKYHGLGKKVQVKISSFIEYIASNGSQFIKLKIISPGEFYGKTVCVFSNNVGYETFKEELRRHNTNSYNNRPSLVDPIFNIRVKEGKNGYVDYSGLLDTPQEPIDQKLDLGFAPHFDCDRGLLGSPEEQLYRNFDPIFDIDLPF
ncbi:hypothetical protein [Aerococcus sp. Group 1]|uniref:hypothetical protein n=1 Tax=Aerococcus urinae (strain CCUG 59500 / ACS-120-V-Col10a) TaxID=2976812 RepID=UPI000200E5AC|nr:hypothetical protein [Aerococcus sp. Group 1]AEA01099.1 hypothetical protein HMPREF9243_1842 [Aerococcus sp. Group 1]MCY3030414.1 hypothetical protein [Aerococcus sp. Group 1]MCY3054834.1 hypothetical protein [Aerococcus sp. Group 1]MCY3056564.1 hypothetical protein [Aerococcus sp. Group 1]